MKSKKCFITEFSIIVAILIIFFEPQMFKQEAYTILPKIDNIYKILKIIGFVILLIFYLKHKKVSRLFLWMLLFQTISFTSVLINSGDMMRFIGPALTTLAMIIGAEILINYDKLFDAIKIFLIYFRVCFILNVISIIIVDFVVKNGINSYFLGLDNRFIFTYLPWITFEFLYSIKKNNKINKTSLIFFVLSEVTLLYRFSVAAMLLSLLWFLLLSKNNYVEKKFKSIFLATLIINISIVVLRIQTYFISILKVFSKGYTLSGRTFLWDRVFQLIKEKPFLGIGMQNVNYDKLFFSGSIGTGYTAVIHAHNSYMTVLYRSGILGLLIYIKLIWSCVCKLVRNYNNKYSKVLALSILITLLLSIFDTIDCSGFYFVLALCYKINLVK